MMEAPDGVTLDAPIGPTDRGTLWRATRHRSNDRAVRFVDPRFCDERFRDALQRMREQRHPHALEIVDAGWSGAQYFVEYAVNPPWWTLGELLSGSPRWMERVSLLARLCDALAQWQQDPLQPLGVGLHNVVVTGAAEEAPPRILPCPAISLSSPHDLFGLDASVLAAIAPETVRGVPLNHRAQDRYALGTLAAQAIGCQPSRLATDDDNSVEAQARGTLLTATDTRSAIEPFLRRTPQVRNLLDTIQHYRHPVPDARPIGVGELRSALIAVTDLIALAETLGPTDPAAAVQVLSWADDRDPGRLLECLRLAARICVEQGDPSAALLHLDRAVDHAPNHVDARRERGEVLWQMLEATPEDAAPARAADLAADMEFVGKRDTSRDPSFWSRAAEAHRRIGQYTAEAQARYEAAKRDGGNPDLLLRYGTCLKRLNEERKVADVVRLAKGRIRTMTTAGILSEQRGQEWHTAFDALVD